MTLPASGDGFGVHIISGDEVTIPEHLWKEQIRRAVCMTPEDWHLLRYTLMKNCLTNKCKQTIQVMDGLFEAIDSALRQMP